MSKGKVHTPGAAARGGLEQALKALGRAFSEASAWRRAALAWRAVAEERHAARGACWVATVEGAEAAQRVAETLSGAPRGAFLPELDQVALTERVCRQCVPPVHCPTELDWRAHLATAHGVAGATGDRHDPPKTQRGTNVTTRQCPDCRGPIPDGGRGVACWCSRCLAWFDDRGRRTVYRPLEAAAKPAAGGAPAPAGEGAEPPLGKIASTRSRAKVTGVFDAREAGCLGRLSCLDLVGPHALCPLHAALLSTLERAPDGWSWWIGVRGEPGAAYRLVRGAMRGRVALAADRERPPVWVPVTHLVSVPRPSWGKK